MAHYTIGESGGLPYDITRGGGGGGGNSSVVQFLLLIERVIIS